MFSVFDASYLGLVDGLLGFVTDGCNDMHEMNDKTNDMTASLREAVMSFVHTHTPQHHETAYNNI
jgi:hypothetical protein